MISADLVSKIKNDPEWAASHIVFLSEKLQQITELIAKTPDQAYSVSKTITAPMVVYVCDEAPPKGKGCKELHRCVLPVGHQTPHRTTCGITWKNKVVDLSAEDKLVPTLKEAHKPPMPTRRGRKPKNVTT